MKKLVSFIALMVFSANIFAGVNDTFRMLTFSELMNPKGELGKIEVPRSELETKPGMSKVRISGFTAQGVGWGNPMRNYNFARGYVVVDNQIVGYMNASDNIALVDIKPGKHTFGVYEVAGDSWFGLGEFFTKKGDGFEYTFEEGKSYVMTFSKQDFGVYKLSIDDVLKL